MSILHTAQLLNLLPVHKRRLETLPDSSSSAYFADLTKLKLPPDGREKATPDFWISGIPDIRISGFPDIRMSGNPDIRIFRNPDIRT